ncbi:uncharacterized protein HMPREF1541_00428 [Cyphellophora europaea CBS 101466]|uniref:Tat pathway signal sequence n=1 Tax=Cyphellophora europaea (strain CBS 101466) TaxID=1220924 RepID=W2SEA5_CYPE1|nr:uncharacterized protein HMPREF1541_00428 [Cyphellophora europaea CBS 101466]ETN46244.1 hypothetical protein HMPREF1541_00428 [Cyphellophora europaea CBS 101466]
MFGALKAVLPRVGNKDHKYSPLKKVRFDQVEGTDSDSEAQTLMPGHEKASGPRHRWWCGYALIFLLGVSVFVNVMQYVMVALEAGKHSPHDVNDVCSSWTSEYPSPIMDDTQITWQTTEYNDSFLTQSRYRGPPGSETDKLWFDLGTRNRHYIVPEHLGERYGLKQGHAKIDPKLGGGFPVLFQFEHDLHCLNLMRQALYWNYDHYVAQGEGPFAGTPYVIERHVGHCMDMLRQALMCQPDTQVFGQYWIGDTDNAFVDFNTRHRCKNFWALKDWVTEHQMSEEMAAVAKVVRRPGDIVLEHIP